MSSEIVFDDTEIKGYLKRLKFKLDIIKGGSRKYTGLMSAIVYEDVIDHFDKESGPEGKWEHWSFFYTLRMEKDGKGGNKILQDSGRLRNNFKPTKVKTSSKGILWFNDAVTKSGFPYAYAHNEGDGNLPKREFMWASNQAQEKIAVQTLQFMIDEGI